MNELTITISISLSCTECGSPLEATQVDPLAFEVKPCAYCNQAEEGFESEPETED